ncbi:MAG: SDR family NAD(P)-dependent oxidoreductase, partial [Verrucomicrobia bacterium]|nr:SDR family NAD(P)-dependent oxidoreductase [Verrucomicrobiota bacterium]
MNERHFLLRNQVALVTGAAQGMGATIAETLAQAGAIVFVADICFDKLETVAATIRTAGGRATAIHLDVTQASDVERATNRMINETGRLDILVNNAGI